MAAPAVVARLAGDHRQDQLRPFYQFPGPHGPGIDGGGHLGREPGEMGLKFQLLQQVGVGRQSLRFRVSLVITGTQGDILAEAKRCSSTCWGEI